MTTTGTTVRKPRKRRKDCFRPGDLYYLMEFPAWKENGLTSTGYSRCKETDIPDLSDQDKAIIKQHGFWCSTTEPGTIWHRFSRQAIKMKTDEPLLCVDTIAPNEDKLVFLPKIQFAVFMSGEGRFTVLSFREVRKIQEEEERPSKK